MEDKKNNVPRYINAEPIEQFIANGLNRTPKEEAMGFDAIEILSEIHFAPTADVEPVRHAHWIKVEEYPPFYKCSNCNIWVKPQSFFIQIFGYCPNCGAKMDEEVR